MQLSRGWRVALPDAASSGDAISAEGFETGALSAELHYKAFGETRYEAGIAPTDYQYTGQRAEDLLGLYFYRARWYDPAPGDFVQGES